MLVLHSSSRCDVCLSEYSWETAAKRPHAIACGHIFCRDCLFTNTPPLCPLCRHVYQPNKMKRLHVDRPDEVDDHRETDLLQRLMVSWDTAPEQLREVVNEIDAWLANRSDDTCVALRKARSALDRTNRLKEAETTLEETVGKLQEDLHRLHSNLVYQYADSKATIEQYATRISEMTTEIKDLQSYIDRFQGLSYKYAQSKNRNPLPSPPQPVSTPNLPSFEQALSESATGVRTIDLPSSPPASYPFEVENRRSRKRRPGSRERRRTYDDTATRHSQSSPLVSSSHYVQPHITTYREPSPHSHTSRLAYHFDNNAPMRDPYALVEASVREYGAGYVSGAEAALGLVTQPRSRREPAQRHSSSRPVYSGNMPSHTVQSAGIAEHTEYFPPSSVNVYQNQPYSAPPRHESPPRQRRQTAAAESSILSSASSLPRNSSASRSPPDSQLTGRSRSSSTRERPYHTNPILASILSDEDSPPLRNGNRADGPSVQQRSQTNAGSASAPQTHAPPADVLPPTRHTRTPDQNSYPPLTFDEYGDPIPLPPSQPHTRTSAPGGASPTRSFISLDASSWGTPAPSHLTAGSLISGLHFFRPHVGASASFDGGAVGPSYAPLPNSDSGSVRTRQASITDIMYEESSHVSRSPVRTVGTMVGVLPDDVRDRSTRSSRDDLRNAQGAQRPPASGSSHASRRSSGGRSGAHEVEHERAPSRHGHRSHGSRSHDDRPVPYFPPPQPQPRSVSGLVQFDEMQLSIDPRRGWSPANGVSSIIEENAPRRVGHADVPSVSFMGNALGLQLEASAPINAPTPVLPQSFAWNQEH